MVAGLENITSGSVSIDGVEVNDVAPAKRGVAMVFQSYALYPHLSVYKNMAFGLRQAKTPADKIDRCVKAALMFFRLQIIWSVVRATYLVVSASGLPLAALS